MPDYALAAELVRTLPAPVILTGGMHDAASARAAFAQTGACALVLARGALGYPWLFEQLLGGRELEPRREEVLEELRWTIERAVEHLGEERATRYLRKFYPWYVARLRLGSAAAKELAQSLQSAGSLARVSELLDGSVRRATRAAAPAV